MIKTFFYHIFRCTYRANKKLINYITVRFISMILLKVDFYRNKKFH